MWVELPRGTDVDALFDAAAERGVQFVKGSDFVLEGYESSLRLAYSGVTPGGDRRGRLAPGRGLRRGHRRGHHGLTRGYGRESAAERLAAVAALAEHQLLGQGDPRRRRGIGRDRDGLGDADRHGRGTAGTA